MHRKMFLFRSGSGVIVTGIAPKPQPVRGEYFMDTVQAAAGHLQVTFHKDDETPEDFVIKLLCLVFKKPMLDAIKFVATIDKNGQAISGAYPRDVANKMLQAARRRIPTP